MITVFGYTPSGNCWKVAQVLAMTGVAFEWVETDSNAGGTRTAGFLAMNPVGKIPVVRLEGGEVITESNAILAHFAEGTELLPAPGLARTRVFEWLFFEQYSHEPYIAVARNIVSFLRAAEANAARLEACRVGGETALGVMERRLAGHEWLTDHGPTIADVSLVAYTQVADEGGFDLARWPGVGAWVGRVLGLAGVTRIERAPRPGG